MTITLQLLTLAGIGYLGLRQRRWQQGHYRQELCRQLDEATENLVEALGSTQTPPDPAPTTASDDALAEAHSEGFAEGQRASLDRVRRYATIRTASHGDADERAVTLRALIASLGEDVKDAA